MLTATEKDSNYSKHQENSQHPQLRPLSTEELGRVNLATLREGINHRCWPKEVIEHFLAVQA